MRFNIQFASLLAVSAGSVLLAASDARATQSTITFGAQICQPYSMNEAADIDFTTYGVHALVSYPLSVICSVPFQPITASATQASFYIDGSNNGFTSSGVMMAYDYEGHFQSSVNYSSSDPTYDLFVTLGPLNVDSYISVLATAPPDGKGYFFGVTEIQP